MSTDSPETEPPMSDTDEPREPTAALAAVDFTATTLRLVLSTPEQELIADERYDLPELDDEEAWAWEVGGRLSTLFARPEPLFALGIGIACPGSVDPIRGVLTESHAQPGWDDLHVVDAIRRHIDAPVVAMNRAHAALRGEMTIGAALDVNDVLYVSLREPQPTVATLAAGTIVRGAQHQPGLITADDPLQAIATTAAVLDTARLIIDVTPDEGEATISAMAEALERSGANAELVVSELANAAPLYGALEAASIVSFEGEREE